MGSRCPGARHMLNTYQALTLGFEPQPCFLFRGTLDSRWWKREAAGRGVENKQSLSCVTFSRSHNLSRLHFTHFINSLGFKMAWEDSTTFSSTCHEEKLQPRTATLPIGRGPSAMIVFLIPDIHSRLPSPEAQGAALTCSNGCLLVHCHGYSCAHCDYHRLIRTFWGNKNGKSISEQLGKAGVGGNQEDNYKYQVRTFF